MLGITGPALLKEMRNAHRQIFCTQNPILPAACCLLPAACCSLPAARHLQALIIEPGCITALDLRAQAAAGAGDLDTAVEDLEVGADTPLAARLAARLAELLAALLAPGWLTCWRQVAMLGRAGVLP